MSGSPHPSSHLPPFSTSSTLLRSPLDLFFRITLAPDYIILSIDLPITIHHLAIPKNEIVGCSIFEFIPSEEQEKVRKNLASLAPANPLIWQQNSSHFLNGEQRWYFWIDQGVFNEQGELIEIQSIGRDITEQKQVEQALQQSESRFRLLAENATDLILRYRFYPAPGFDYVSPAATAITGYTPEEFYADPSLAYRTIHPDDLPLLQPLIDNNQLFPSVLIHRFIRKDGRIVWVEGTNIPIYDPSGRLIATEGIKRDITQRKEAEIAQAELYQQLQGLNAELEERVQQRTADLRQSQNLYRSLVEDQADIVCLTTPDHIITFVNEMGCQVLGMSRHELTGLNYKLLLNPEDFNRIRHKIRYLSHSQPTFTDEFPLQNGQGQTQWFHWHNRGIFDLKGKLVALQSVGRDMTEQRQAEEHRQQSLHLESLLKQMTSRIREQMDENHILNIVVQELATGLDLLWCNTSIYDLDSQFSTLIHQYPQLYSFAKQTPNLAAYPDATRQLEAGGCFQACDVSGLIKLKIASLACPISDEQGIIGELWLVRPPEAVFSQLEVQIAQQVAQQCAAGIRQARLVRATQQQIEKLAALNLLKDDFIATVSHELRTPLTNIKMAVRMARLVQNSEKQDHYLTILEQECDREIALVNDLLDLQKMESDTLRLNVEMISLQQWIPILLQPFWLRAQQSQQTLTIHLDPSLTTLTTDRILLTRILSELLTNACKYTPANEEIRVEVQALAQGVEIRVVNGGTNLSAEEIPQLFQRFYRLPNQDPWKQGGTGLGLALVKEAVHALKGEISIQSQSGLTTFTVRIPDQEGLDEWVGRESRG